MTRIWLVNWHFQSRITLWCRHNNVSMGLCWQVPKFIVWRLWSIYFDHHLSLKPSIGKRRKQSCTPNIRILQWNCCGIRGKLPHLQHISRQFDVFCLQNILLYLIMPFRLSLFKVIRKDSESSGQRGICILLRNNIIFSYLDLLDLHHSSVVQGITINLNDEQLIIYWHLLSSKSTYLKNGSTNFHKFLTRTRIRS